jgi:predicted Co/Zn/Cd cation transporter (cation efflux family)
MSLAPLDARQIEIRSLRIGIYASACMAVAGICVHVLSGSYALLLDGLYSAVMVGSGLVASRISRNVVRPPDRAYPYGYDGQEALYVLFRSLVLIGVLSFAAISGLCTLIDYAR